jgi:hypothetical protein
VIDRPSMTMFSLSDISVRLQWLES